MVVVLLLAGGCRFQLNGAGPAAPLDLAAGDEDVHQLFASGINFWR